MSAARILALLTVIGCGTSDERFSSAPPAGFLDVDWRFLSTSGEQMGCPAFNIDHVEVLLFNGLTYYGCGERMLPADSEFGPIAVGISAGRYPIRLRVIGNTVLARHEEVLEVADGRLTKYRHEFVLEPVRDGPGRLDVTWRLGDDELILSCVAYGADMIEIIRSSDGADEVREVLSCFDGRWRSDELAAGRHELKLITLDRDGRPIADGAVQRTVQVLRFLIKQEEVQLPLPPLPRAQLRLEWTVDGVPAPEGCPLGNDGSQVAAAVFHPRPPKAPHRVASQGTSCNDGQLVFDGIPAARNGDIELTYEVTAELRYRSGIDIVVTSTSFPIRLPGDRTTTVSVDF